MQFTPLSAVEPEVVESLLDRAFGGDRLTRTAYRIRAGMTPVEGLSFAAIDREDTMVGSIQAWPIEHVGENGIVQPMIMIGPVAVEPALQLGGIGRDLMRHALHAAARSTLPGADALMLIGDPEYYGRFFGFSADRTGGWSLPGPVERHRLLAHGSGVPDQPGRVGARLTVLA